MSLLSISHFSNVAFSFLKERLEDSLSPEDKQIIAIASIAFACVAALYLICRCCCFKAEVEGDDDNDDDAFWKDSSPNKPLQKHEFPDGTVMEGTNISIWKRDKFNQSIYLGFKGQKIDFDGKIEKGSFSNASTQSKLYGRGEITFPDGAVWTGNFVDGELDGKGKKIHSDGATEEGEFKKNLLDGSQGKMTYPDGTVWKEGGFQKGVLEGRGKITQLNGDVIEGDFSQDKLNGRGKKIYASGVTEEGIFSRDELDGKGKITYPTGNVTEGFFKNGKLEGFGKKIRPDGTIEEEGLYEAGVLVKARPKPTYTKDKDPAPVSEEKEATT